MAEEFDRLLFRIEATLAPLRAELDKSLGEVRRFASETKRGMDEAGRSVGPLETAFGQAAAKIKAAAASVQQSIERMTGAGRDFASDSRRADIAAYGAELDRLRAKFSPLFAAQQAYRANLAEINQALRVGAINEKEYADAVARTKAQFAGQVQQIRGVSQATNQAAGTAQAHAGAVKLQAFQLANLGQQLQDVFVQLGSGTSALTVLVQQGPQITTAMGGVRNAIALVTAAINPFTIAIGAAVAAIGVLAVGVARLQANEAAVRQVSVNLMATGRAAELAKPQIAGLIDQIAKLPNVSREAAQKTVAELARVRQVGAASFSDLAQAAAGYAKVTGKELPEATRELAKGLTDPIQLLGRLDEEFGLLTQEQFRSIRAMAESGDAMSAVSAAVQTLKDRFGPLAKEQGDANKAADSLAKSWDGLMEALAKSTPVEMARQALIGLLNAVKAAAEYEFKPSQQAGLPGFYYRNIGRPAQQALEFLTGGRYSAPGSTPTPMQTAPGVSVPIIGMTPIPPQSSAPAAARAAAAGGGAAGAEIDALLGKYNELERRKEALRLEGEKLQKQLGREGVDQIELARAIERNKAAQDAVKDAVTLATEAHGREAAALRAPIAARAALRAGLQAEAAALQAGLPPLQAKTIGEKAAATASMQLRVATEDTIAQLELETEGIKSVTAAYGEGSEAVRKAREEAEIALAVWDKLPDQQDALARAIRDKNAALRESAVAKAIDDLQFEVDWTKKLIDAYGQGADAINTVTIARQTAQQAQREGIDKNSEEFKTLERLNKERARGAAQLQIVQGTAAAQDELRVLQVEIQSLGLTNVERQRAIDLERAKILLEKAGTEVTEEQRQKYLQVVDALATTRGQLEEQRQAMDLWLEPVKNALQGIQSAISDTFRSIFRGGVDSFKDLADKALDIFTELAAQIATLLVFRPILANVTGSILGPQIANQLFPGLIPSGGGGAAGGGVQMPSIGGIFDAFTGGVDKLVSWGNQFSFGGLFGSGGGGIDPISGLATQNFGGMLPFGFGDALPFIGSVLPGLLSGNFKQAAFGGGGAAAGAVIGSLIPGVGTAIGAAIGGTLGNLLGGLFGGKPSVGPTTGGSVQFGSGGFEPTGRFSQDNGGDLAQSREMVRGMVEALNAIRNVTGLTFAQDRGLVIGHNPAEKFGFDVEQLSDRTILSMKDGFATFDEAFIAGIKEGVARGDFTGIGEDVRKAIERTTSTSMEDFGADLEFAAGFRQTFDFLMSGLDPVNSQLAQIGKAAKEFGAQFSGLTDDFKSKAVEFGLATEGEVNQALQNLMEGVLGLRDVGEPLDGVALQLEQTRQNFEALQPVLESIGVTAEDAAQMIAGGIANARTEMGDDFLATLGASIRQVTGRGFVDQLSGISDQINGLVADALLLFDPSDPRFAEATGGINELFNGLIQGLLDDLDEDQLQSVIDMYAGATDAQGIYIHAAAGAELATRSLGDATDETAESIAALTATLQDWRDRVAVMISGDPLAAQVEQITRGLPANAATAISTVINAIADTGDLGTARSLLAGLPGTLELLGLNAEQVDAVMAVAADTFETTASRISDSIAEIDAASQALQTSLSDFGAEVARRLSDNPLTTDLSIALGGNGGAVGARFQPLVNLLNQIQNATSIEDARIALGGFQQTMKDLGLTADQVGSVGALAIQTFDDKVQDLTGSLETGAEAVDEMKQALDNLSATISGSFTSATAVQQLDISDILSRIAPDAAMHLTTPFRDLLAAANAGGGYRAVAETIEDIVTTLASAGTITTEQVGDITSLVVTLIGMGDQKWQDLQDALNDTGDAVKDTADQINDALAGLRTAEEINLDSQIRILRATGQTVAADLLEFQHRAAEQLKEAELVGADLVLLKKALAFEEENIKAGANQGAADADYDPRDLDQFFTVSASRYLTAIGRNMTGLDMTDTRRVIDLATSNVRSIVDLMNGVDLGAGQVATGEEPAGMFNNILLKYMTIPEFVAQIDRIVAPLTLIQADVRAMNEMARGIGGGSGGSGSGESRPDDGLTEDQRRARTTFVPGYGYFDTATGRALSRDTEALTGVSSLAELRQQTSLTGSVRDEIRGLRQDVRAVPQVRSRFQRR